MLLKDGKSLKTYLCFLLAAAVIIGASVFYFNIADTKKNTSTIVFNSNTDKQTTLSSKVDVSVKTSSTANSKTTTTKVNATVATEAASERLYIDINSADADELLKLKGIGEILAEEILSYREKNGNFRNIEEIMNVKGIGEGIFADIRDSIYVIDPVYEKTESSVFEQETETETEYIPILDELAPIDINTADMEILMLLPHVDEDIACRIIDFREHTSFSNGYELLLINGLSQNEVSDILPYITT